MITNILLILLMILLSAFFSCSEIAYASANEIRMRNAAEQGGKMQKWAYWIYRHYDHALTSILIGNNLTNNFASSIMTMMVISLLGNGYAWISTVVITVLLLIFGESLPKIIGKEQPERIATAVAMPLRGLMWITYPVVYLVQGLIRALSRLWKGTALSSPAITEDDLEIFIDTAETEGTIDENTTELLQSALEFDDMLAYEIITPRVDMIAIDMEDSMEKIMDMVLASRYSRIPVYEDSKDNIIGVLHLNRFMKQATAQAITHDDIRSMLMPACFVPKTSSLPAVLGTMRQCKCHMVIVDDEFGGTLGILTMEDILEELVGDIWDETDLVENAFTMLEDGRYEASGDMRVAELLDALDMDDRHFDDESTTLGGWAVERLGGYPRVGESFVYDGLLITVERVHKRRVMKVLVQRRQDVALDMPQPKEAMR